MTADEIIQIVCDVCGITVDDLKKRSRKEPIPTARALIAHFLHKELRMFPREILPLIGHPNYNRTAIYYYVGKKTLIESRMTYQRDLRDKFEIIEKILSEIGLSESCAE